MCDEDFGYGDPASMFDYDGDGELDHAERALYYDYLDRSEREDEDDEDEDDDDWNDDNNDDDFSGSYFGIMDEDIAKDLFDDDDYPFDRQEDEEYEDEDEEREQLDVTKVVKREKRKVDLTDLIENAYIKCDTFDSIKVWKKFGKLKLRDQLRVDLMKFCMYLSSSDGNVDESEARFFSSQLGAALSVDNIRDFIKSQKIDSAEFVKAPPQTIVELVNNREVLDSIGAKIKYVVQEIVGVFDTVGFEIIACDGTVDPKEREDLKSYIQMMYEYAGVGDPSGTQTQNRIDLGENVYEEGVHKCGVDISPGLYKLFPKNDGSAYFGIYEDANCRKIVSNENFVGQSYVYINETHYLELCRCVAVSIEDAVLFEGEEYPPGEYYVGRELPAGEYKLYVDQGEKSGYYAILQLMADGKRHIVANKIFTNTAYVEVSDNQFLQLCRCSLKATTYYS